MVFYEQFFLEMTEVAQILALLFHAKTFVFLSPKMGWDAFWAIFSNLSGHPVPYGKSICQKTFQINFCGTHIGRLFLNCNKRHLLVFQNNIILAPFYSKCQTDNEKVYFFRQLPVYLAIHMSWGK
jgi:hypothetical protein